MDVLARSEPEPARLFHPELQDPAAAVAVGIAAAAAAAAARAARAARACTARREQLGGQHRRRPRRPPHPDDSLQSVDRHGGQQQQEHLVCLSQEELPGPLLGQQLRGRDADAVGDEHDGENDDQQMVREPEVGERIQGGADLGPSEASRALGPARRERVGDDDQQHEDPARHKGSGRSDVAERQRFRGAEPDLLLAGPLRPDKGRGRDKDAVEGPGHGADDCEPDVVAYRAVEIKHATKGRRSVFYLKNRKTEKNRIDFDIGEKREGGGGSEEEGRGGGGGSEEEGRGGGGGRRARAKRGKNKRRRGRDYERTNDDDDADGKKKTRKKNKPLSHLSVVTSPLLTGRNTIPYEACDVATHALAR